MGELRTIGVYGFDDVSFLDGLTRDGITMLLDVRQRRGVRGPECAWANSQRLQSSLAAAGPRRRPAGPVRRQPATGCVRTPTAHRLAAPQRAPLDRPAGPGSRPTHRGHDRTVGLQQRHLKRPLGGRLGLLRWRRAHAAAAANS